MNIQFNNFVPSNSVNVKNNFKKIDVYFKGNEIEKSGEIPPCSYASVQIHPAAVLSLQLIKDGYTKDEINEHGIFYTTQIRNVDFGNPMLIELAMQGEITKDDIFSKSMKSIDDVKAMQKAYVALKEKFNTQDVCEHVESFNKLAKEMSEKLSKRGFNVPLESKYSAKSMILSVLRYVNKDNEPLLQKLLYDKNFNNVYLHQALMTVNGPKDMKYPMQVIEMAQEIGYKNEFSMPLSILISEAEESNIHMIEKMLEEQDFLSANSDFVSNNLMSLLRNAGTGLSFEYTQNDDLTLNEIQELLQLEEADEDLY